MTWACRMLTIEELLTLEGNVPTILALKEFEKAYFNQLQHRLEVHSLTLKRSVAYLLEKGLIEQVPYEGKVPNVKSWLVLTDFGKTVADCLLECQRKLGAISKRTENERRKGHA